MPEALPYIGTALGVFSAIQGSQSAGQQNQINQDQLKAIAQQRHLGRLLGRTGASGNPFSSVYAPAFNELEQQAAASAPKPPVNVGRILHIHGE